MRIRKREKEAIQNQQNQQNKQKQQAVSNWFGLEIDRKLTTHQLQIICQQMAFALSGGMALPDAIQLAAHDMRPAVCARFLQQIGDGVQQGESMTQAVQKSRIRYSPVFLEFVMAGEQNGAMQEAMEQAAAYFTQQHKTRQMLISALFYPAVLLVMMICAFTAMFLFVVPAVEQTYDNFGASLPPATQAVLQISTWMQDNWVLFPAIGGVLAMVFFTGWSRIRRHPVWQKRIRSFILHLPAAGKLFQQYWFVQISQALGLMLSGGMLLSNSLEAVGKIYRRSLFASELEDFSHAISAGYPFDTAIRECSFIPDLAGQMLTVSEHSGTLGKALIQLSRYYQNQVQQKLHRLVSLLEPCCVIVLGLGILVMAGSLFLPLVQSYQYLL